MQINSDADLPLAKEIYASSDRAAAILSMAWVDEQLRVALKAALLDDEAEFEKLTGPNGPLGPFVASCRLAVLLGIIMPETANDLRTMAKLRNEAAHLTSEFSFADQSVLARVSNLRIYDRLMVDHLPDPAWQEQLRPPRPFDHVSCRMHFIRSASFAAVQLNQYSRRDGVRVGANQMAPFW